MKKLKAYQWGFLLLLVAGTIWALTRREVMPMQVDEGKIFGTYYHIKYRSRENLHTELLAAFNEVDVSLSMFNPKSTLSRLNSGEIGEADDKVIEVFQRAAKISQQTDGAFDATVAPLVNAWGFGFQRADAVTSRQIDSLRAFVGYQKVRLQGRRLLKDDARLMLDFGAIAKGYAVDCVASVLKKNGVKDFMVEVGGEVVVSGQKSATEKWRIGVSKPTDDSQASPALQTVLEVSDAALATSGNYRNFYYKNGKKYTHTIDPATGYPVQHNLLSASVMAPDCATADAFATAFMVMGMDRAKAVLKSHPELQAYFIYAGNRGELKVWCTEGVRRMIVGE